MNKGTKIRTILRIATSLQNAAVMVTSAYHKAGHYTQAELHRRKEKDKKWDI